MPRGDFGGKSHLLTREDRVRGGKAQTGLQKLQTALAKRKYCDEECLLWPCSVAQYAEMPGPGRGLCAFKTLPPKVQRQILNLVRGGRTGLLETYSDVLGNIVMLAMKKPKDIPELRRLTLDLERFHRVAYGDRQSISAEEPVRIIVNFRKGNPNPAIPDPVETKQTRQEE